MAIESLDILGIGNAILDVQARAEDADLARLGMTKGTMRLIGTEEAESLYAAMGPGVESSGGSAANTCAAAGALGAKVGFLGKVADDELGQMFRHDITAAGVHFPTAPLAGGAPTARCLILVTPDGQRTMNTYLGACVTFGPEDLDADAIRAAQITYLEGYLFDPPHAQEAFRQAARIAHDAGRKVAITLSDPFCVERHRDAFLDFIRNEADIVFANEHEILTLYRTDSFEEAAVAVQGHIALAALTRSEQGSVLLSGGERHAIGIVPTRVVDTTGAGDAYAAGVLAGLARGLPVAEAGRWGAIAAAEAISHFGARPQADLKALVSARPAGVAATLG